jgi:hypothetical protein
MTPRAQSPAARLPTRLANLSAVADLASGCGWQPLLVAKDFQTGILLAQSEREQRRQLSSEVFRLWFSEHGLAVTTSGAGLVRLSMPETTWRADELAHIQSVLQTIA